MVFVNTDRSGGEGGESPPLSRNCNAQRTRHLATASNGREGAGVGNGSKCPTNFSLSAPGSMATN